MELFTPGGADEDRQSITLPAAAATSSKTMGEQHINGWLVVMTQISLSFFFFNPNHDFYPFVIDCSEKTKELL